MNKPLVSLKARNEFREYFVQERVLRQIRDVFDSAGVRCDLEFSPPSITGDRRTLVEQYYVTVDWTSWKSVQPVINAFEAELSELLSPPPSTYSWDAESTKQRKAKADQLASRLLHFLKADGFDWVGGRLVRSAGAPVLDDLASTAHKLEGTHLAQQIQRMKDAVETDPSLAIGTAKELIETVCKTILEERGKPVTGSPDIPTLTKALLKELDLVPEGVPDEKRGADIIRNILRSLGSIGNELAQLRGLYGTGHGKAANAQPLNSRHAKLAVGTAATLATFLFETHQENPARAGQ